MELLFWGFLIVVAIFTLTIVWNVAERKEGCSTGSAIFLSLFFTPIAGLLYCLNFPPKQKKQE